VIKSPCIDVCRMSERLGLCEGCLRTLDEIARWPEMSDADKRLVLASLTDRRGAIGEQQLTTAKQRV